MHLAPRLLRSALLKRFESSAYAFRRTVEKMITSHDQFLSALEAGLVLTGDALRDWSSSDVDDIEEFLSSYSGDADNVRPASGYRVGELRAAVVADRDLLHRLHDSVRVLAWDTDPKLIALTDALALIAADAETEGITAQQVRDKRKVIIFSYFADTVEHLTTPGRLSLRVAVSDVASAPRGVLLFLTGGPGEPGVPFVPRLEDRLGPALRGYRLVMFDQRGTGAGALDCPALQRQMGASDLTVPAPAAVRSCAAAIGPHRRFYATADTVADIAALRAALGVARLTGDGVSYGSYVAERFALAYPGEVSRLVLHAAAAGRPGTRRKPSSPGSSAELGCPSSDARAQIRCSVAESVIPPKYWSRTWRNTGSPGAACRNSVMDEHSFSASTSPKTCSAVRPRRPARTPAHSVNRAPRTGCARYARASASDVIA
jgi:pimeloyl-ACP methyl ester carboxylesterase